MSDLTDEFLATDEADLLATDLGRKLLLSQRTASAARAEASAAKVELREAQDELTTVHAELSLYEKDYETQPAWLKPRKAVKGEDHRATILVSFSDSHIGEFVDDKQMDGFNRYDMDIAAMRIARFFDRTITLARTYVAGVGFDGVVLNLGGDLTSGSIHDELLRTNLVTGYEAIEFAVAHLIPGIHKFAEEFGKVLVVSEPGNHGRTQRKPEAKGYSADNSDTHIARLIARHFSGESAVSFNVPSTDDAEFDIYGWKFAAEHGHAFKSSGSPEIGSIGTMMRGTLRKLSQKAAEGKAFKYGLLAHYHQLMMLPSKGLMANGSLKGYDEYARGLHLKPEEAQQMFALVSPEKGVTLTAPIFCQNQSAEKW